MVLFENIKLDVGQSLLESNRRRDARKSGANCAARWLVQSAVMAGHGRLEEHSRGEFARRRTLRNSLIATRSFLPFCPTGWSSNLNASRWIPFGPPDTGLCCPFIVLDLPRPEQMDPKVSHEAVWGSIR